MPAFFAIDFMFGGELSAYNHLHYYRAWDEAETEEKDDL